MLENRDEIYARELSSLIRCETVSEDDPDKQGKFASFRDLLRNTFPHLYGVCEYANYPDAILLCWRGRSSDKPLLLMNHHDVVEAPGKWTHAPFSGDIAEGKLWGRGTLDTKGGLWAMLRAADELAAEGFVPEQDIYFESASTEETDGRGAEFIAKMFREHGVRFATVLDEGGMILYDPIGGAKGTFAMVGVAEKGCINLKFTARSSGGHASMPGKNTPLVRLGKFMRAVEKRPIFKVKVTPVVKEMLLRMSPTMSGVMKFVCSRPQTFAPLLGLVMPMLSTTAGALLRTTVAFTMCGGSDALNVLPQEAWVTGNMRFSHHQGGEASVAAIKRLARKFDIETEIIENGFDSGVTAYDGDGFRRVESALADVFPEVRAVPYIMLGASDSRFFYDICDHCVRFVPFIIDDQQLASVHGIDENVSVSCLAPAVDFYKHFITGGNHGKE